MKKGTESPCDMRRVREERMRGGGMKREGGGRECVRWPHIQSLNARSAHYTSTPPPPVKLTEKESGI